MPSRDEAMVENLQARARALCAIDIEASGMPAADRYAAVERYWIVVALEIMGSMTVHGQLLVPDDIDNRRAEFQKLRQR